jgi:hypothetical protein
MVMAPKWVAPMATTLETRNQAHTTAKSNLREDHRQKTCLRRYASMGISIYTEGRGFSDLLWANCYAIFNGAASNRLMAHAILDFTNRLSHFGYRSLPARSRPNPRDSVQTLETGWRRCAAVPEGCPRLAGHEVRVGPEVQRAGSVCLMSELLTSPTTTVRMSKRLVRSTSRLARPNSSPLRRPA